MPFSKTIEQPDGSDVRHWRLQQSEFHHEMKTARFVIAGYRSKAAFTDGKKIATRVFMGDNTDVPIDYEMVKGFNPNQIEAYILATHPAFAGAVAD